ncbi:hypothetical protein D5H75_08550 [Bailinhaonella thermotolerans]|uniref:Copper chaperone PCu(A)C n=1 Tax=Bailinhaonella thermotolerans TaxID=1070861 RepID=A0A3A4BI29_9ACTN|nr:hypothetical protein D5H75_08550 [Bailinhaonella thermotolerans]
MLPGWLCALAVAISACQLASQTEPDRVPRNEGANASVGAMAVQNMFVLLSAEDSTGAATTIPSPGPPVATTPGPTTGPETTVTPAHTPGPTPAGSPTSAPSRVPGATPPPAEDPRATPSPDVSPLRSPLLVHFALINSGDRPDRLVELTAPGGEATLHLPGSAVDVPPRSHVGGPVPLAVLTPRGELESGDSIRMRLRFRDAGVVELNVPVKARGGWYATLPQSPPASPSGPVTHPPSAPTPTPS